MSKNFQTLKRCLINLALMYADFLRSYREQCIFIVDTNMIKGYPFEVLIPDGLEVKGAVLSDQRALIGEQDRLNS